MTEFAVKNVTLFRVATFFSEVLLQIYFSGIYKTFNITNSANLDYQMEALPVNSLITPSRHKFGEIHDHAY